MSATGTPLPLPPAAAHLTVFRGAHRDYVAVFVEGPDDVEALKPWLKWRPLPVGGCSSVIRNVSALRDAGERGFVGIIDADCERLEGRDHADNDLIVTESHDLECDLLASPVFDRLLSSIDEELLRDLTGQLPPREALLQRGLLFGLLRWHFFRQGLKYPSGRLSPHRYLNGDDWSLNRESLLSDAATILGVNPGAIEEELRHLQSLGAEPWKICNGHDLVAILAVAMRGKLCAASKYPQATALATALRLSIGSNHLAHLHVWRELRNWERSNAPWKACV